MTISIKPGWRLKSCPRCHGDMCLNPYTKEYICLQCGYSEPANPALSEIRRQVGSLGGIATFQRHGREYMSELGKKGGRPKLERPIASAKIMLEEERLPGSLRELKRLYKSLINERDGAGQGSVPERSV